MNEKNKGGRPETWTEEVALEFGKRLLVWMKDDENIFWKEFILQEGLHKQIIAQLSEKFEKFSELIETARQWQEVKILKGSMNKKLSESISKFVLINHHDYKDKSEVKEESTQDITYKWADEDDNNSV